MDRTRHLVFLLMLIGISFFWVAKPAYAQTAAPFQMVGHIQSFKMDPTLCPAEPAKFFGASMVVNGITLVIPCYSVILMPARYITPQQMFELAPAVHVARGESGLALDDTPKPLAAIEVAVDGNIVCKPTCLHIAGQVHISQQSLNMGSGFIHDINFATGEMCVGSGSGITACMAGDARVRLNDPCLDWLELLVIARGRVL